MAGKDTKGKTASPASSPRGLPIEALTQAGRLEAAYQAFRRPVLTALAASSAAQTPLPTAVRTPPAKRVPHDAAQAAKKQAVQGARLVQQGKFPAAVASFRTAFRLNPTIPGIAHDLGIACLRAGLLEDAVIALREAVRLDPTFASGWINLAAALDHLGRTAEAMPAFEASVRLRPDHHVYEARLGELYEAWGRTGEAACRYRAAAAAAPPAPGLVYRSQAARVTRQTKEAEALLREAISEDPLYAPAHLRLGHVLSQNGHSAEAGACLQTGIDLDPRQVTAWYALANTRKFTHADRPVIERMAASLRMPGLSPGLALFVRFALGKVHDDLGDYATAIEHFEAGNVIRGNAGRLNRDLLGKQVARIMEQTPSGFLENTRAFGVDDATPLLIIGMPRSGTTLVEQILSSHPAVAGAGELRFWRQAGHGPAGAFSTPALPAAGHRLAHEYLAVLHAISPDTARVTDKMPFNFSRLGLIRQLFPNATIIHCRRNPVDICLSVFTTVFESPFDFASDRSDLVCYYRQYERLMAHWHAVLPAGRFIDVEYEDLVSDPETVTRRLVAAAGLEWDDACLSPDKNTRAIATASLWQARQPIYKTSVARWRRYEPWLGALRTLLDNTHIDADR